MSIVKDLLLILSSSELLNPLENSFFVVRYHSETNFFFLYAMNYSCLPLVSVNLLVHNRHCLHSFAKFLVNETFQMEVISISGSTSV